MSSQARTLEDDQQCRLLQGLRMVEDKARITLNGGGGGTITLTEPTYLESEESVAKFVSDSANPQ